MMLQRCTAGLSLLLATGLVFAAGNDRAANGLKPRREISLASPQLRMPEKPSGELFVKFRDGARMRATAEGLCEPLAAVSTDPLQEIVEQYGLTFRQAVSHRTAAQLRELEVRAESYSGAAQPDLAGMLFARPARPADLLEAAKALNDLSEIVEYATVYGLPQRILQDPDCGEDGTGSCYEDPNLSPFCDDAGCCERVCEVDPFCCAEDPFEGIGFWDPLCVAIANLYCGGGDRCASGLNGSCTEIHPTPGCVNEDCCNAVCDIDDFCCTGVWDEMCVTLATELCLIDVGAGPTPEYDDLQGYKSFGSYFDLPGGAPGELAPPAPNLIGYGGEGYDLAGLEAFAQELLDVYGVDATGEGVIVDGSGTNVAVIEWAYYQDHEELGHVISEPGQTLIMTDWVTEPNHATACLGILCAKDNGKGVTGIVPGAQPYFFPLTSIEEGPRQLNAWVSAIGALGPGDVISCSYGPAGSLNSSPITNTLIGVATASGISVCMAAGNDCDDLGELEDIGDSGGVVVGAGSPGRPYFRLPFSNYTVRDTGGGSNTVHVQSWGSNVTTCGYGDLYFPNQNHNRSYTVRFSGTSSATPINAGMMVAMQGLAKQFYGFPFPPGLMRAGIQRGFAQGGLSPRFTGGFDETQVICGIDSDPDSGPNDIGPYPVLVNDFGSVAAWMLNQDGAGFNDSPFLKSVTPLVGETINTPSIFHVTATDDLTWNLLSEPVTPGGLPGGDPGSIGGGGTGGPIQGAIGDTLGDFRFLAYADVTSMFVQGGTLEEEVLQASVNVTEQVLGPPFWLGILQAHNATSGTWDFLAFRFAGQPPPEGVIPNPVDFIVDYDGDGIYDLLCVDSAYSFGGITQFGSITGHERRINHYTIALTLP